MSRSKKSPNGFKPDKLGQAIDRHYEDQVRTKTGGISGYINNREIDSITNDALIEVKRSINAVDNPQNFLKQKSKQIKATIASAEEQGKRAEFWYKYGVHPEVRQYIENKGGIVRTGLGD